MPCSRAIRMAGEMMRSSSSPNWPFSLACGLTPQTAMRGLGMSNQSTSASCISSIGWNTAPMLSRPHRLFSGMCTVASTTFSGPPANIMA